MMYKVVSPLGWRTVEKLNLASRPSTLNGKTVCEVYNNTFKGNESFPIIREFLLKQYPAARVVPWTEIPLVLVPSMHPELKDQTLERVKIALKEKGCEAVISQFGG